MVRVFTRFGRWAWTISSIVYLLINKGHDVVLHARNAQRGKEALDNNPGAANVLIADFSVCEQVTGVHFPVDPMMELKSNYH